MTAGWQVIVYGAAFVAYLIAAALAFLVTPQMKRPWWKVLVAVGLALTTLVPVWNANAVYD